MNEETDQPPLARMATISRPSFWIYFIACAVLFACAQFKANPPMANWRVSSFIAISVFAALLLELVNQRQKNERITRLLTNASYVFQVVSAITFIFIIFCK